MPKSWTNHLVALFDFPLSVNFHCTILLSMMEAIIPLSDFTKGCLKKYKENGEFDENTKENFSWKYKRDSSMKMATDLNHSPSIGVARMGHESKRGIDRATLIPINVWWWRCLDFLNEIIYFHYLTICLFDDKFFFTQRLVLSSQHGLRR